VKALLLVHGLPVGGTEVMVCHLARRLRSAGVDVELGCLDLVGELGEELRSDGFEVVTFDRRPGLDVTLPIRIARRVSERGYDLVHAHQYTCYFYAVLAKCLCRKPLVFTEHGRFYPDLPSTKRRVFNRLFGGRIDRVTAVSEGVKRSLSEVERFDADRIEVLYNGIDVEHFAEASRAPCGELREAVDLPADAWVIGTVGRLDTIKNHGMLLFAFDALRRQVDNAYLALLGGGPERDHLESLARRLELGDRVRFLGQRQEMAPVLASFDVFALSSLSEGTPMTILEAMAAGVPIVSTGVGGIPEVLTHGEHAMLVDGVPPDCHDSLPASGEGYVRQFVDALERVRVDVDLRTALVQRSRERVESEFSLDVICARYLRLYEAATGHEPARQTASVGS